LAIGTDDQIRAALSQALNLWGEERPPVQ
jgi:hypothetical protein